MKASPAPTIKDVARVAQVHYSTVSLALRDHPSIPERTRERVRRAAARVGYRPSPVLGALSQLRRRHQPPPPPRIGYLVNRSPGMRFDQMPYQQHFVAGARQQAEALGYDFELLFVAEGHHDSGSLAAHLEATGTTGFIIGAFEPGLAGLALDWERYTVVKIDSSHVGPPLPLVSNDQLQVVRLAFQQMKARGYRRIGLAVGQADEDGTDHRHAMGYLIEQAALPPARRVPPLLFPYNCEPATASSLLGRWVRRERVDAVLCNWLNLPELLAAAGLRVPDEVAAACLCLLDPRPALAGVVPNLRAVGANAVSLLATLMRAGERGAPETATTTYVQARWHPGASAPHRR